MAAPTGHASGATVIAVSVIFTVLALIATLLRLYTRFRLVHNAGLDDAIIAIATTLAVGLTICTVVEVHLGVGRHQSTLSAIEGTRLLKTLYASIALYQLGLSAAKLSIVLQYLRIFPQQTFRWTCFAFMAILFVYTMWTFWSTIFLCVPVSAFWDPSNTEARCLDREALWFANAAMNILTDIALAVMPLPLIKRLNVSKGRKIGLGIVFALGGFTCVLSILRLESIYAFTRADGDSSYNNSLPALWSVLEVCSGILCSCLPTLRALVSQALPQAFGQSSGHETKTRTRGISNVERSLHLHTLGGPKDGICVSYSGRGDVTKLESEEDVGSSPGNIKVVTVVNQEVEMGRDETARSENGSTKGLIRGP